MSCVYVTDNYYELSVYKCRNAFLQLSLYSTAIQTIWRRGLALGNAPNASILRWGYQHVGILEPTQTLKFALPPTPNPSASQWNIGVVGTQRKIFALAMYISCFLCRFHLRLVANVNTVFSGIWALGLNPQPTFITYTGLPSGVLFLS